MKLVQYLKNLTDKKCSDAARPFTEDEKPIATSEFVINGILRGANGATISQRSILHSVLPPGNRRSVLGITRFATGAEVQKNMSGPQPSSGYLAGSRYQVGKDPEKREGFGKVLSNLISASRQILTTRLGSRHILLEFCPSCRSSDS